MSGGTVPPEQFVYLSDQDGDGNHRIRALTLRQWGHRRSGEVAGLGTSGGVEITDDVVQQLADEAEAGYDLALLRPRPRLLVRVELKRIGDDDARP